VSERELERKAETAALLLEVARQLGESLDPDRIYRRFHELLGGVVQHDGIVVSSYDERDGLIRAEYVWVDGNEIDPATLPPLELNPDGGMQSRVITEGVPLLENAVAERVQEPGTYYTVDREGSVQRTPDVPVGVTAAIMVPVKDEGRVVGVVQVMSDHTTYVPEQVEILEGLAVQMAAAVRNARLQDERRRLEAAEAAARAVAAEREQAAHVLQAVGDGIFLCAEDGVVQLWNRAAEVITGIRAADVVGRGLVEVIPGWPALSEAIPVGGGTSSRAVTLPVERGGRDLWLSFVAVHGAGGVVYAFRDVTNERRLEEEKSDFVATVSHELRTPTAAIYGAAETLLRRGRDLAPVDSQKLLEMIASQASRLGHIVDDILLTTKLDRGELPVDREAVDLAELTAETVEAMRPQLPDSASVAVELASDPAVASGDPDRIQQVLVNLVDNAVKYGGGAAVTVRVGADERAAKLSVSDAGPGIPLAEQQRIFEKFYRGDPQLTRNPAGTGLGLYISRELVRRMGGRLHVRSETGAGATFVVELPRADRAA
jgi:two-component system phosphate regulon sensor histidine kinase PhoR